MIGRDDDLAAAGDDLRTVVETSLVVDDCPHPFTPDPKEVC